MWWLIVLFSLGALVAGWLLFQAPTTSEAPAPTPKASPPSPKKKSPSPKKGQKKVSTSKRKDLDGALDIRPMGAAEKEPEQQQMEINLSSGSPTKSSGQLEMPTQKKIQKDLSKGWVPVQKRGPPPLTKEQKKERDEQRAKEEEEAREQEKTDRIQAKEREMERANKSTQQGTPSTDRVRKLLEEQKQKQDEEKAKRQPGGGSAKIFVTPQTENKQWVKQDAPAVANVDEGDFPSLS